MNKSLDPSFLISKLVAKYRPGDLKALRNAIDIIKSYPNTISAKNNTFYLKEWMKITKSKGEEQQVQNLKKDVDFLAKNLIRSPQLFQFLYHFTQKSENKEQQPQLFTDEHEIPLSFIYVLQGVNCRSFEWSDSRERFVLLEKIPPNLYIPAQIVSQIGSMVKMIRDYIERRRCLTQIKISAVLKSLLVDYLLYISSIEQMYSDLTISQFLFLLNNRQIDIIKSAAIIINTIKLESGGILVNRLMEIEKHGDELIKIVANKFRNAAFEVIEKMSIDWSTKGRVDDPFGEFFVKTRAKATTPGEWWSDLYYLSELEVPKSMLKSSVGNVFSSGLCLNFVRQWEENIELDIEAENFDALVKKASEISNSHMMTLFIDHEKIISRLNDAVDFVLFRRGDFATVLLENSANAEKRLPLILHDYIGRKCPDLKYLEFGGEGSRLRYEPQGISCVLFTSNFNDVYEAASALLLRVRRAQFAISRVGRYEKGFSQGVLLFEMLALCNTISMYFNLSIVSKTAIVMDKIKKAKEFAEIVKAFEKNSTDIIESCWISAANRSLRDKLYMLMTTVEEATILPRDVEKNRNSFYSSLKEFCKLLATKDGNAKILYRQIYQVFPTILMKLTE
ncbi:hypothetical protein TVAG_084700 [Trichomonas vaginalis G3]|uniref:Gamma tubulin complex component protein N-terminal domain-containing protein n=1 Tax=Trichomonas vaginalis (strain ATCC PRA-98 / G3) TaxID=412133 RepID=A2F3R1_TRIV3|nr:microtubule nucleation by interphase microtubule organizing center [Trichomonas vaginalis G3]EAY00433.1 hypothetical protein TVAG_084700 [Trichomonas vaginalis G3]KAI5493468.1 microtubule nucleation by interphase microtubule organizing center [Trichomonas vaginalis G3]|eukprot:XP_001313362.1 hypothetical protein [Trichomonas vaginalis G3]